jgi:hypothetical protein
MAITARQKKNRAKKARAFVGPPTLKSQHKSHATRRAKKAAASAAPAAKPRIKIAMGSRPATAKPRIKIAMGSRPATPKGKQVYKTAIGPKPMNSQHKSHMTRRANKAAAAVAAVTPAKPRVKIAMGSRAPAASKGKQVYKTAIGPKPMNSQHKSHMTRRANKAAASAAAAPAAKPRIKVAMGSRPAKSGGGGGGRSAAAKKAWATRRANGWSRKKKA